MVCQKAIPTTRGALRSESTFLKALHMTKDIPEVLSQRETLLRLLLHLPHPKVMPTSQGTPVTSPGLAIAG